MKPTRVLVSLDLISKSMRLAEFASEYGLEPAGGSFDKGEMIGIGREKTKAVHTQYRIDFPACLRHRHLTLSGKQLGRLEAILESARRLPGAKVETTVYIGVFFHSAFCTLVFNQKLTRAFSKADKVWTCMYPCSE